MTIEGIKAALLAVKTLHQITIDHVTYDCGVSRVLEEFLVPALTSSDAVPIPPVHSPVNPSLPQISIQSVNQPSFGEYRNSSSSSVESKDRDNIEDSFRKGGLQSSNAPDRIDFQRTRSFNSTGSRSSSSDLELEVRLSSPALAVHISPASDSTVKPFLSSEPPISIPFSMDYNAGIKGLHVFQNLHTGAEISYPNAASGKYPSYSNWQQQTCKIQMQHQLPNARCSLIPQGSNSGSMCPQNRQDMIGNATVHNSSFYELF